MSPHTPGCAAHGRKVLHYLHLNGFTLFIGLYNLINHLLVRVQTLTGAKSLKRVNLTKIDQGRKLLLANKIQSRDSRDLTPPEKQNNITATHEACGALIILSYGN